MKFRSHAKLAAKNFEATLDAVPSFSFSGSDLIQFSDDSLALNQSFYLAKIEIVSDDDAWNMYVSRRKMLACW